MSISVPDQMYAWARDLYPYCRSLTGEGVRRTLAYLKELMPDLTIHQVPSGTRAFDWVVPDEWNIRDAHLSDEAGKRIIDFRKHNLHVVGYSVPVDQWLSLEDLEPHLYSLPDQPDAIPYVTSYYRRAWGFCLTHLERRKLAPGRYHAVIDSTLAPGSLTYADLVLPGEEEREVLLSTYVCHPSMANNELSGIVVVAALARWLKAMPRRRYTYRIVFIPETIGSIVYLSRNLETMKGRTVAGWVVSCVGDERAYSMVASRLGDTFTDRLTRHALRHHAGEYIEYDFLWPNRGSDERNYCSPGIDLPVVSVNRSKYGAYPEYHTSLDDLSLISPTGLGGSFELLKKCIEIVEANRTYRVTCLGEPRLGPRGLYPSTGDKKASFDEALSRMMNVIAYADGSHDLLGIAERIGADATDCIPIAAKLVEAGVLAPVSDSASAGRS